MERLAAVAVCCLLGCSPRTVATPSHDSGVHGHPRDTGTEDATAAGGTACWNATTLNVVNGGFELPPEEFESGEFSFDGWVGQNTRFGVFAIVLGDSAEGAAHLSLEYQGHVETAPSARMTATPGQTYRLQFAARKPTEEFPSEWAGLVPSLRFYDPSGAEVGRYAGSSVQPESAVMTWEDFTFEARAPVGTVAVGVRFEVEGDFPNEDARVVEVDHVRLTELAEGADSLRLLSAPTAVSPGHLVRLPVRYTATGPRRLRARLLRAGREYGTGELNVRAGRGLVLLDVSVAASLPDEADYSWTIDLEDSSGPSAVTAQTELRNVRHDSVASGEGVFGANDSRLVWVGRVDHSDAAHPALLWQGSEVRARFQGTRFALRLTTSEAGEEGLSFLVRVDGSTTYRRVSVPAGLDNEVVVVANGLADTVHTIDVVRDTEVGPVIQVDGVELDAGAGLLHALPLPPIRLELYGDSVTSGASPEPLIDGPSYNSEEGWGGNMTLSYGHLAAEAIGAEYRAISKGATGIARSYDFFPFVARDYFNRLRFNPSAIDDPATNSPWHFEQWQPHYVVVAYGQNDAGNGVQPDEYATAVTDFLTRLRAVYPEAWLVATVGEMSGALAMARGLRRGVETYRRASSDTRATFVILHEDGLLEGSHPHDIQHRSMAVGGRFHAGLAETIVSLQEVTAPCR